MEIFNNLDLSFVGVAVAGIFVLGFIIYLNDRHSITNRSFFLFSVFAAIWSTVNYIFYQFTNITYSFFTLKLLIFFGVWFVFFLFKTLYVFPSKDKRLSQWFKYILLPLAVLTSILSLTPLVFEQVTGLDSTGRISSIKNGPGIFIYAAVVLFFIFGGIYTLARKSIKVTNVSEKNQIALMSVGLLITFTLIMMFNLVLPAFFNDPTYIPLGALCILPFVILTSFAIYKHNLLGLKRQDIIYGILAFTACAVTAAGFVFIDNLSYKIIAATGFLSILLVSIEFIRNIFKLEEEDQFQSELLSLASHQLKGPMTAVIGYNYSVLDGDTGPVSPETEKAVHISLSAARSAVTMIEEFLSLGRIKRGQMNYDKKECDLKDILEKVIFELKLAIESKKLTLDLKIAEGNYRTIVDESRIRQVMYILIDNATKYTPSGNIRVSLSRQIDTIIFSVKDSGVGLTDDDKTRLFTKFGKGKDSEKVNPSTSGLGLYLAKEYVEAHGGKIYANSEGSGKGSTFIVELPVRNSVI